MNSEFQKIGLALMLSVALPTLSQSADRQIIRIATMPEGAEVTGLSSNPLGELFLNAQHPGGKDAFADGAPPALVGYVHGFDSGRITGPSMSIPEESLRKSVNVAEGEYVIFGKAGDDIGSGQKLGGVYDVSGKLMYISNAPDFNGFVSAGANKAYLFTAWEGAGRDGIGAVSRIVLNRKDGRWTSDLSASAMMDLSPVDGGMVLCSGIVTPWGTPLFAEEYFFYGTQVWNHPDNYDEDERASFQEGNDNTYIKPKNVAQYLGKMANPYRYGYMIEINDPAGPDGGEPVKHYATGRLSHETAAIMPDMRTVYMTDDDSAVYSDKKYNNASGGVLFKFVADVKGDLSSGTLYAAKLKQDAESDPHKAGFDVTWIELGNGSNAEIAEWIAEYDNVQVADYTEGSTNYISDTEIVEYSEGKSGLDINGDGKTGSAMDARAAFLESRRTAAALGATNEWDKLEGVSTDGSKVYISASGISFSMDKNWGHKDWSTGVVDASIPGDIALDPEGCGGTYIARTDEDFSIVRIDPYVIGKTTPEGACDENIPANPDNILALSDGSLLIGEDAGPKRHVLDMLWLVR